MALYKCALVTGASAGFGAAISRKLADSGYTVIACARRENKLLELASHNKNIIPLVLDVTDSGKMSEKLGSLNEIKKVDVLINNAGLALGQDIATECKLNEWDTMVDTNVRGLLHITHYFLPQFVSHNHGYIINIGSTAGSWPYRGGNVYGGSKAFVDQFSKNLRVDLAGTAVKVTLIKPGLCGGTEFSEVRFHNDFRKVEAVYDKTESISAEDIADTISYLLNTPAHLNINEMEMMPVCQTYGGLSVTRSLDLKEH